MNDRHAIFPQEKTRVEHFWRWWAENREFFLQTCLRWLRGQRSDAEDIVSLGAIRATEFLGRSSTAVVRLRPWMLRILQRLCVDHARRKYRSCDVHDEGAEDSAMIELARPDGPAERAIYSRQLGAAIMRAIASLPPRLHDAFLLRFVDELEYDEISLRLAISPANARKRTQEARQLLRDRLAPYHVG